MFAFDFNHDVISRATALVDVGIIAYMIGSLYYDGQIKNSQNKSRHKSIKFVTNQLPILTTILFFILFIVTLDISVFTENYGMGNMGGLSGYLFLAFSSVLITSIVIEFNNIYISKYFSLKQILFYTDKKLIILTSTFLALFLYLGYRTLPLQILIIILSLYALFIKPIEWKKFLVLSLVGLFFMTFITIFRASRNMESAKSSFSFGIIDSGMDLIINNRNLYVAVDYVDRNGITFGTSMIGNILAPVPFLQRFTYYLFNIDASSATSSMFFSTLEFGKDPDFGLGTNIIADLYLGLGIFGVVIFMFLLGYFISRIMDLAKKGYYYSLMSYGILVSYSVYIVRAEFFFFLRLLIWTLVLSYIFKHYQVVVKKHL